MFQVARPKILFCFEATNLSLTHTEVPGRWGTPQAAEGGTVELWLCLYPTFQNPRIVLPFQKAFTYINVTALLEQRQSGAVASLRTNPCEKLDPKAVGFGSCDPGSAHSSLSHPYILLCVAGAFRPSSHISQNPLLTSSVFVLLIGSIHEKKFISGKKFFYPIPTLVLGTVVKTTSGQKWSGAKWDPATY